MNNELTNVHGELNTISEELGLDKPKDLKDYLDDDQLFEEVQEYLDNQFEMVSIDEISDRDSDVDFDYHDDCSEEELVF
jgi:hypothetical protein